MIKYKTIEECRSRNRLTSFRVSSQEWRLFLSFEMLIKIHKSWLLYF